MEDQEDGGDNVWYRLGYTLEQARGKIPGGSARVRTLAERETPRKGRARPKPRPEPDADVELEDSPEETPLQRSSPTGEPWDAVIAAGATALLGRLVESLPRQRKPGVMRLLRAGVAGAGAALVRELVRSYRSGGLQKDQIAELAKSAVISGTTRGLLYGVLVEPRIPGPPVVRGAAYGYLEHLVSPWGGLTNLVGARAPHRSVPILADLLDDMEPNDDTLMEHILFGITLAALYGALPADADEDEDDDDED